MIPTPGTNRCRAHNAQDNPCGNLAVAGGLYCRVHQPQTGEEAPEAHALPPDPMDEEIDAESRLTSVAERVDDFVGEATTVAEVGNRLLSAFDVLIQVTTQQIQGGVEAIDGMLEVIQREREALRQDVDFLLADFNLGEEQRQLLAAQALQNGQSMGELLSDLVSERLTWEEDSLAVIIDPRISLRVKELAHGRSTAPAGVINGALQYCIENEAL